jgi:hypothetical protein
MAAGDALIFGFKSEQGCQFGFSGLPGQSEDKRNNRATEGRLCVREHEKGQAETQVVSGQDLPSLRLHSTFSARHRRPKQMSQFHQNCLARIHKLVLKHHFQVKLTTSKMDEENYRITFTKNIA